ncbi:hypothetical protein N0V95_009649, partial [Ascochyta clinopodiicola]
MESTLTLQIPFILLGRRDTHILDLTLLSPNEQATAPITLLLKTLQHFCPTLPIHACALEPYDEEIPPPDNLSPKAKLAHIAAQATAREHAQRTADQHYRALISSGRGLWLLRPLPRDSQGDGQLTAPETTHLGRKTWACSVLLLRVGVPVDTSSAAWTRFECEAREVLGVLRRAFVEFRGKVMGLETEGRYWDLVAGDACFLKVVVEPIRAGVGKRVLVLAAAFERELDLLRGTGEVVRFVGVGRWLEWVLLGRTARVQHEAWRCLGRATHESGDEDERYRRTKGRRREWWDVMHDMDELEIVDGMRKSEDGGNNRLGIALHASPDHTYELTFQGRRSTLDAEQLIAHTRLLAHIVNTAQTLSLPTIADQLEILQLSPSPIPLARFSTMLTFLTRDVSNTLINTLTTHLNPLTCTPPSEPADSTLPPPQPTRPREAIDPFYSMRRYLEKKHEAERADM